MNVRNQKCYMWKLKTHRILNFYDNYGWNIMFSKENYENEEETKNI